MQKRENVIEHHILVPDFLIYSCDNRFRVRVFFACILGIAYN